MIQSDTSDNFSLFDNTFNNIFLSENLFYFMNLNFTLKHTKINSAFSTSDYLIIVYSEFGSIENLICYNFYPGMIIFYSVSLSNINQLF